MLRQLVIYSLLSGMTVFLGGLLAYVLKRRGVSLSGRTMHMIQSFVAGTILSAVALVLVPRGIETLSLVSLALAFAAGAWLFMLLDKRLEQSGGQAAILLAMLLDFVPETIALGAVFASETSTATLLAVIIGLQNFPEAFNSFHDLSSGGWSKKKTLGVFFALSFLGMAAALFGHFVLRNEPVLIAALMTFASGGILYLLMEDIIPESKLVNDRSVPLWAALGFLVGVIGEKIV